MALSMVEATSVKKGGGAKAVMSFDFGDSLKDAVAKFGEGVVFNSFVDTQVIRLQAAMRSLLAIGKQEKEIQLSLKDWKPGVARARVMDPVAAFARMSQEEQKSYIQKLVDIAKSKK